jgi:hypothetical protein
MSVQRPVRAFLVTAILLVAVAPPARSQGSQVSVRLTLDRQSSWNSLKDPILQLRVRAQNLGDTTLRDLSFGIALGQPIPSRSAYDSSLVSGPDFPLKAETHPQEGELQPGTTHTFDLQLDLLGAQVSRTDSRIYPLRVDLRSGDQPTGAELRTPVIFLVRKPLQPLELSWMVDLAPPPAIGPDGKLVDVGLAQRLAPGGDLRAEADALGALATGPDPSPVNLAVSPRFVDELRQMADGFSIEGGATVPPGEGAAADAAAVLKTLQDVVRSNVPEVSSYPYAAPNLAALLRGGLATDLTQQIALGNETFSAVFGRQPGVAALRPPGGALDQASLDALVGLGAGVVLGNDTTVARPPDPNGLTLSPTGLLSTNVTSADVAGVPVVLPDAGVQALLESDLQTDPTLAAQGVLGELAAVWQEAPSPGFPRGVAITTAGLQLPAPFWEAFAQRVAQAPFLRPVRATQLVDDVPPPVTPDSLADPSPAAFTHRYVEGIKRERRRIDALRSMLVDPGDLPGRLGVSLLVAESGSFLGAGETTGRRWIDGVNTITRSVFDAAQPTTAQIFTIPPTGGTIPISLGDPGTREMNVTLQLSSSHLTFPQGDTRSVRITQPHQIVFFPVEATTTGRFTVQVVVKAPSGRQVTSTNLVVQSTTYNRIALLVTGGAALALVLLWVRRLFRRTTS